jgi:hypothetical protein
MEWTYQLGLGCERDGGSCRRDRVRMGLGLGLRGRVKTVRRDVWLWLSEARYKTLRGGSPPRVFPLTLYCSYCAYARSETYSATTHLAVLKQLQLAIHTHL